MQPLVVRLELRSIARRNDTGANPRISAARRIVIHVFVATSTSSCLTAREEARLFSYSPETVMMWRCRSLTERAATDTPQDVGLRCDLFAYPTIRPADQSCGVAQTEIHELAQVCTGSRVTPSHSVPPRSIGDGPRETGNRLDVHHVRTRSSESMGMNDRNSDANKGTGSAAELPKGALKAIRQTEGVLVRGSKALKPMLLHAVNVERFNAAVQEARMPIKEAYAKENLDYQLARHALWISETVDTHEKKHPEIREFGPSLVLLVREAERRFIKEERTDELPALISEIASGTPRRKVRELFLPPKKKRGAPLVLAAVRAGRMEVARKAFEDCNDKERAKLKVLTNGLNLILGIATPAQKKNLNEPKSEVVPVPTSIKEAVLATAVAS